MLTAFHRQSAVTRSLQEVDFGRFQLLEYTTPIWTHHGEGHSQHVDDVAWTDIRKLRMRKQVMDLLLNKIEDNALCW